MLQESHIIFITDWATDLCFTDAHKVYFGITIFLFQGHL